MATFLSREELLGGLPARQASTLLFAIEATTAKAVVRSQHALDVAIIGRASEEREQAFLAALRDGRDLPVSPTVYQIERHAARWQHLVPASPDARAALLHALARKYRLARSHTPGIRAALGVADAGVRRAYARRYGGGVEEAFSAPGSPGARIRWAAVAAAVRADRIPPFWSTLALTIAFGLPQALLALPIVVARTGLAAGAAIVIGLGLVNLLTMAYMAEAALRFPGLAYGNAFVGQLVRDYLGPLGAHTLSATLSLRTAVVLLAVYVGIGLTFAAASPVPAGIWTALMFLLTLGALYGRSIGGTVRAVLAVAAANIVLVSVTVGLAARGISLDNLTGDPGGDVATLGAVLGVSVMLYFGHVSVVQAVKLTRPRDPDGRRIVAGVLAGTGCVTVVVLLWVLVVSGAVPAGALARQTGTALVPLAEAFGGSMATVGLALTFSLLGLAGLRSSQVLYSLVLERLRPRRPRRGGRWLERGRLLAVSPLVAVFLLAEGLLLAGDASFTTLVGLAGVSANTLVAGIFPVLLLLASRRKGDAVTSPLGSWLGRPGVLAGVYAIFLLIVLAHATVIWESGLARSWAALLAVAVVAVTAALWRRGAFAPRTVVELCDDRRDGRGPRFRVVSAGQLAAATVELEYADRAERLHAAEGPLSGLAGLERVAVELPPAPARELKVWVHRVTPDGDSEALPATVEMVGAGGGVQRTAAEGRCLLRRPPGCCRIRIVIG